MPTASLLRIDGLEVRYATRTASVPAVNGVSFSLDQGVVLGLVGESGCGKSTVGRAIMGVLPQNASVTAGRILLDGVDLLTLPPAALRRTRWARVSMVFQTAMSALNPVIRVGRQLSECMTAHGVAAHEAHDRACELLETVGLGRDTFDRFPHQLSGGMRQRVALAMAWALDPPLVIADEPTTALDVVTQERILDELLTLGKSRGQSIILITHDMAVVAERTDVVVVLYGGSVMEQGSVRQIFHSPSNPYTMGLISAVPDPRRRKGTLVTIPGAPPTAADRSLGCPFSPRCPFAEAICHREKPLLHVVANGHSSACHFPDRAADFRMRASDRATWEGAATGR